ncbi:MAG: hypothetical protein ACAI44_09630 [Candidatus Sericytochromatia bacterium]
MSEPKQKSLARQRFLALLGTSALGLWLLQVIPSGLPGLKLPLRRKHNPSHQVASRVKIHPLAVKRES